MVFPKMGEFPELRKSPLSDFPKVGNQPTYNFPTLGDSSDLDTPDLTLHQLQNDQTNLIKHNNGSLPRLGEKHF